MEVIDISIEMISDITESEKLCYACANDLVGKTKTCYACANDLVGLPKNNYEDWECFCDTWECRCTGDTVLAYDCYCPLCQQNFVGSSYLANVIEDPKQLWLANLIMHYRHQHRKWDEQWKYIERNCNPGTYDVTKIKVNNQIKRKLLRDKTFMAFADEHEVSAVNFLNLMDNEGATLQLINKVYAAKENETVNSLIEHI